MQVVVEMGGKTKWWRVSATTVASPRPTTAATRAVSVYNYHLPSPSSPTYLLVTAPAPSTRSLSPYPTCDLLSSPLSSPLPPPLPASTGYEGRVRQQKRGANASAKCRRPRKARCRGAEFGLSRRAGVRSGRGSQPVRRGEERRGEGERREEAGSSSVAVGSCSRSREQSGSVGNRKEEQWVPSRGWEQCNSAADEAKGRAGNAASSSSSCPLLLLRPLPPGTLTCCSRRVQAALGLRHG